MEHEKLLGDEKWGIECLEFPRNIFYYKKWEFKNIGYLKKAGYVSKFLYKPSFLSFYSPEDKPAKCYIAVKELRLSIEPKNILNEIKSLMMMEQNKTKERKDSNIIRLYGFSREDGCYRLYMEWMDFSLKDLYGKDTKGIKWILCKRILTNEIKNNLNTLIGKITVEIIDALCELVSCEKPIIHRDVKPENILLSYTGKVKLADFGEARFGTTKTTGGTPRYRPPEAFKMDEVDGDEILKYDVFSLGVVVLEYFCGMHPYEYITCLENPDSRHLDNAVIDRLVEEGVLTKWSEEGSVFTKNKLIDDNNFHKFLSISLQPIKTRATPFELQQTHFYSNYKTQNGNLRTDIAKILNELEIHPEPRITYSYSHQARRSLPFILLGIILIDISLITLAAILLINKNNNLPILCENVGGTCMENYETGCQGTVKMILPFSCNSKNHKKCCVDAKVMAKIDSPNWQNNCSCVPDNQFVDSVCIDEIPPGTKRLEEELNEKFPHLIRTFLTYNICDTSQIFKEKRAINIFVSSDLEKEKQLAAKKFIYAYLIYIVNEKTPCNTGIEEVIYWGKIGEYNTTRWFEKFASSHRMPDNSFDSHITIILNSCGAKNWGIVRNS